MSEMVERVTNAIYARLIEEGTGGCYVEKDPLSMSAVTLDGDFDLPAIARAAIEAMREPTAEMAVAFEDDDVFYGRSTFKREWSKAIDAALKD